MFSCGNDESAVHQARFAECVQNAAHVPIQVGNGGVISRLIAVWAAICGEKLFWRIERLVRRIVRLIEEKRPSRITLYNSIPCVVWTSGRYGDSCGLPTQCGRSELKDFQVSKQPGLISPRCHLPIWPVS